MATRANASRSERCTCSFGRGLPTPSPTPVPATTPTTTAPTTTTAATTPLRRQTCFIWGDPHVVTFDSTAEAMAGRDATHMELWAMNRQRMVSFVERECKSFCGVHWLVRSDEIKIQANYAKRGWMDNLAVAGSFLRGHTLIFSADGTVKWDGALVV